jgi:hypothetical protein
MSAADLDRRTALRKMKILATSLLVAATIVFIVASWLNNITTGSERYRAFAEAARWRLPTGSLSRRFGTRSVPVPTRQSS